MTSSVPVVIASDQTVIPVSDNASSLTVDTPQLPAALVGNRLDVNSGSWLGSTAPTVGQKTMANSVPVVLASNQAAIPVSFGVVSGASNLNRLINLYYNQSDGAVLANAFKQVLSYTIPVSYTATLLKFVTFQNEFAISRLCTQTSMGTHVVSTNIFTAGSSYTQPQFAATVQANVTTAIGAASNLTYTVGYTNQSGVAGRTGTISIPKSTVVNSRFDLVLQSGDIGVTSIQSVSVAPITTGAIELLGFVIISVHEDQSTTNQTETSFNPGVITFPAGTNIVIEYAGGTVSKTRLFDALIELVS